jgi:hypothetical protein
MKMRAERKGDYGDSEFVDVFGGAYKDKEELIRYVRKPVRNCKEMSTVVVFRKHSVNPV